MKKAKLIILGLDGGTFKIIDPLIAKGKLPNLSRLIQAGSKGVLRSTVPPLTAPAWVSLMTGVNPGKHGLFDFKKLENISYDVSFAPNAVETHSLMHSQYYAGKTIWDILSKEGLKLSVLMMPMTYPAWKINGYMLSGFPSPDFKKPDGYPSEWVSGLGPLFDIAISINDKDKIIRECRRLTAKLEEIIIKQLKDDECDVYSVVFSSTDFLQHYLWKYLSFPESEYSHAIEDAYVQVDNCIGKIMNLVDMDKTTFVVLSDHGFMETPKKHFHTNAWLAKEGYLGIKKTGKQKKILNFLLNFLRYQKVGLRLLLKKYFKYLPASIQKKISGNYYYANQFIWHKTTAYRYKFGLVEGIAINLKGRQALGTVEQADYEAFRSQLINKLKNITDKDTGAKVVSEVYRREEIYSGKFVELVPDIIFILDGRYKGGVGVNEDNVIENAAKELVETISGNHDMNGILVLSGQKFKKGHEITRAGIIDIFPTILYELGLPVPGYVDGKIIIDAFKEECRPPVNYINGVSYEGGASSAALSASEEEAMKKALTGLGYLS